MWAWQAFVTDDMGGMVFSVTLVAGWVCSKGLCTIKNLFLSSEKERNQSISHQSLRSILQHKAGHHWIDWITEGRFSFILSKDP